MAFQSTIAARQSIVAKPYTPIKRDMLMLVTGYDIDRHVIFGDLLDGRKAEVSIDSEAFARGIKSEMDAPYQKHRIDKKMSEKIPANGKTFAVLESAEVLRKGKNDVRIIRANRVHLAGPNKSKAFESLITFTINHKSKRVERVQSWSGQGFAIDSSTDLNNFEKRLSSSVAMHAEEEAKLNNEKYSFWLPYVGFELRTLATPMNPVEPMRVVDVSGRFETKIVEKTVAGESVKFKQQLSVSDFETIKTQYLAYAKGVYGEDTRVEVSTYTSYPVSQYSKELDFSSHEEGRYNPFLRMATAKSHLAIGDTSEIEGGNYGCWGVIKLSPDALNQETGEVRRQYYVSAVFVNTRAKNFVHQKIKSSDGQLPVFDEGLKSTLMQYGVSQQSQIVAPVSQKPVQDASWTDLDVIPGTSENYSAPPVRSKVGNFTSRPDVDDMEYFDDITF